MVKSGFKNITVRDNKTNKDLSASKLTYLLSLYVEEQTKLRKLTNKITSVPETVRVYTNPLMKRERK